LYLVCKSLRFAESTFPQGVGSDEALSFSQVQQEKFGKVRSGSVLFTGKNRAKTYEVERVALDEASLEFVWHVKGPAPRFQGSPRRVFANFRRVDCPITVCILAPRKRER